MEDRKLFINAINKNQMLLMWLPCFCNTRLQTRFWQTDSTEVVLPFKSMAMNVWTGQTHTHTYTPNMPIRWENFWKVDWWWPQEMMMTMMVTTTTTTTTMQANLAKLFPLAISWRWWMGGQDCHGSGSDIFPHIVSWNGDCVLLSPMSLCSYLFIDEIKWQSCW